MENIYEQLGLQRVINASGRMTKLGVSTVSPEVAQAVVEGASNYVVIDDLLKAAGQQIGAMIGTPDVCVTSSASAGIALTVASLICGSSLQRVQHLFDILPHTPRREVILLKGQNVDFGAPIAEMIQLGGGEVVEVGYANGSKPDDIRAAICERTLAVFFVQSHHCVQKEMVRAAEAIAVAAEAGVPCIVDAAAEEDLCCYIAMGADFVCYSGAKAIEGPTSGMVACRTTQLADNLRLQYKGIGRAMKVGKEGIVGLMKAIQLYTTRERVFAVSNEALRQFAAAVADIPGCTTSLVQDEAGRAIYRCKIAIDPERYGMDACELVRQLQQGSVAIFTRDYQMKNGSIAIDPRPLNGTEELDIICQRLWQLSKGGIPNAKT
ncbi:MAG: DgaE family pyridoxal phosphate-dependent ammonia lyase [Angelakisella sp.]